MSGGSKKSAGPNNTPPLNASSKDEENFIQYVFLFFFCLLFCLGVRWALSWWGVGEEKEKEKEDGEEEMMRAWLRSCS